MRGVLAYHVVMTAYGFWLPNDPRGSWSSFVRSFELYRIGGSATKIETRQSVAETSHDHAARMRAKSALVRPPVIFTGVQARTIAHGFKDYATRNDRRVYALAVLPDHAHLVVERCVLPSETLGEQFKARATLFLAKEGLHPFANRRYAGGRAPTPWARKCWPVFLDSVEAVWQAIEYVRDNPVKAGYRRQHYDWLTPFVP